MRESFLPSMRCCLALAAVALFTLVSCQIDEKKMRPEGLSGDSVFTAYRPSYSSSEPQSATIVLESLCAPSSGDAVPMPMVLRSGQASIPAGASYWHEGDSILLATVPDAQKITMHLGAESLSDDGFSASFSLRPDWQAEKVLAATLRKGRLRWMDKSPTAFATLDPSSEREVVEDSADTRSCGGIPAVIRAELSPDGSFAGADVSVATTPSDGGELRFRALLGVLEFSVSDPDVKVVRVASPGIGIPQIIEYDFDRQSLSLLSSLRNLDLPSPAPGAFYLPLMPSVITGLGFDLLNEGGTVLYRVKCEEFRIAAGEVLSLGNIEGSAEGNLFTVAIPFKTEESLSDMELSGSNWPFREEKGSSGAHVKGERFHLSESGYAAYCSAGEYYLNAKTGLKFYPGNLSDYFELPCFARGRIVSVSIIAGSATFAPSFVDSRGNVLDGGARGTELEAGVERVWNFGSAEIGEPCRIRFNRSSGSCDLVRVIATYEFKSTADVNPVSEIAELKAGTSLNASFGKGLCEMSAEVQMQEGKEGSIVLNGAEYRPLWAADGYVQASFDSPTVSLPSDSGPLVSRAWASSPRGWREYSPSVTPEKNGLDISFWTGSSLHKPFVENFKSGKSSASNESGIEMTRHLADNNNVAIKTFVPKNGTLYYIDNNSSKAVRVSSSGEAMAQMTRFTFPALEESSLSSVTVTLGPESVGTTMFVCLDPSTPELANATRVSGDINATPGVATEISCNFTARGTSYSLVFPEEQMYYLHNIHLSYSEGGSEPVEVQEEEPDDPSADRNGVFDYSSLASKGHPRLVIDKAGFDNIRRILTQDRASNRFLCEVSNDIIALADRFVADPNNIKYKLDASGTRLLSQSRAAFRELSLLSYAWQVTGNSKYLNSARNVISVICGFPDWHPSHFLDAAEMCMGAALAYDWLYDALSLEEKKLLHRSIVSFALTPGLENSFHEMPTNWNQVCNASLISGAIALYEKDKEVCYNTIEKGIVSNRAMAEKLYAPDGNTPEGYGYWGYGSGFQAILMQALETAFGSTGGLENISGLDKTGEYMLFMAGPCGPFSYADGGSAEESPSAGMWWFARHASDPTMLTNELRLYRAGKYGSVSGTDTRFLFLIPAIVNGFVVDSVGSGSVPSRTVWSGNGTTPVVMVHTGWKFDADDHYLGIKGGEAQSSHGHMDAGSFVYDALGQRWSADAKSLDYDSIEVAMSALGGDFWNNNQRSMRWDMMQTNSLGHSTISIAANDGTIAKTYPTDHCVSGKAVVLQVLDTPERKGAVLDMSAPLRGQVSSARRTIELVSGRDLVVTDEITALSAFDAPLKWHMMTPASISIESGYELLSLGGKTMYLKAVASDPALSLNYLNLPYKRPSDWHDYSLPEPTPYWIAGYEIVIPAGRTVKITTTLSPDIM
ncbi:MAG: heparinase II/III family protein [Bacteroidales bacterium]|nr:heparinase II/III family protein [Bacteroidales bacterium]